MEDPDVPQALELARKHGLPLDTNDLTYFLGRETIIVTRRKGMAIWRLEGLRLDGAKLGSSDSLLPPTARTGRGAWRPGRDV